MLLSVFHHHFLDGVVASDNQIIGGFPRFEGGKHRFVRVVGVINHRDGFAEFCRFVFLKSRQNVVIGMFVAVFVDEIEFILADIVFAVEDFEDDPFFLGGASGKAS